MIPADWSQLTTTPTLTAISVPPGGGTPWAINANQNNDNVYTFAGSDGWQLVPGVHLTFITVAENGMIWDVDGTNTVQNNIYIYSDNAWQQPIAGILTNIVVGRGGDVWGINTTIDPSNNSNIFKYVGGANTWMSIPGYLTNIALGTDGTIWGINTNLTNNNIFKYVGTLGQQWQPYTTGQLPNLTQIAVGGDNSVWGIDNANNIWGLDEVLGFQQISGSAMWISAGEVSNVWAIATDGSTIVASFPDLDFSVEIDNRPVYHTKYAAHGSVGQRIMPGIRAPLKIVAEEWLDDRFRDTQEHVRQRISTQSPTALMVFQKQNR